MKKINYRCAGFARRIVAIFAFSSLACNGEHFQHVALYKCDQKLHKYQLVVLVKGDPKVLGRDVEKIQNIYLFNGGTTQLPATHRLCVIGLSQDNQGGYRRTITWISKRESIQPLMDTMGLSNDDIRKLMEGVVESASKYGP